MIFAREISDHLTSPVKQMDATTRNGANRGLETYVIFCSADQGLEPRLKELIEKEQIGSCAVSLAGGIPPGFKVPKDADVTVILFEKQLAKAAFSYRKGEMKQADVARIVDAIEARTETPYPVGYYAPAYTPTKVVTAKDSGTSKAALGPNPCVLVFTRQLHAPLAALVDKLEDAARNKAAKLDNFLVLLGDAKELEPALQEFAGKRKLQNTTLSVEAPAAVKDFQVSRVNDITLMICAGGVARHVYQFRADALTDRSFDKLLDDLNRILKERTAQGL